MDDDRAPTPEEMLRVMEEQRAATTKYLYGASLMLYLPWGVAWLLGFTALFLHYGLDGQSYAPISQMQAVGVLMGTQVVAGAIVARGIARMNRGVRGETSDRSAMYGYAWFGGMALMVVLCVRMSPQLPPQETGLLWAATSMLVVSVLYMAGGAIWLNWPMFFLGAWAIAVNVLGVLLGAGWHALLTAVLLGGGSIVAGLWLRRCA